MLDNKIYLPHICHMGTKKFHMDNVIHLRLPQLVLDKLNDESWATGISKQELIRSAVRQMLEKKYDKDLFLEAEQMKPNFKSKTI